MTPDNLLTAGHSFLRLLAHTQTPVLVGELTMHSLATLRSSGYQNTGLVKLKLTEHLDTFPCEILDNGRYGVANTLEILDLSGTGISSLPEDFGSRLPRLKIAFFSNCNFKEFPRVLAECPRLEMVAFRSNGMTGWANDKNGGDDPESDFPFPPRLRWLILTENNLQSIPSSIGGCTRLEKCMLAGNGLADLPDALSKCRDLTLLRLAANKLKALPPWLPSMPKLAFLSFAGNPCAGQGVGEESAERATPSFRTSPLPYVDWDRIEFHQVLGEGASGIISKGTIRSEAAADNTTGPSAGGDELTTTNTYRDPVAIKIFRGALTSDGTPYDEMAACLAAGQHDNLVRVHGQIRWNNGIGEDGPYERIEEHLTSKAFKGGLIMELIPPRYRVLGLPPSFDTCTRDCFNKDGQNANKLSEKGVIKILVGVASAAAHLHGLGIAHGDLYAHNILVSDGGKDTSGQYEEAHAILSDFGAATMYESITDVPSTPDLEKLEVLAFGYLVDDLLGLMEAPAGGVEDDGCSTVSSTRHQLSRLYDRCVVPAVADRPTFAAIHEELERM
ncbi:serine threonine protein kinase [Ophiostoma piceae UAMH 11346]|uniref:Serine threonine protein kinase n=1 Tax=Ophiostoma piceae (strain UAMH 11346) TaxID=1262450 RepID=S3C081_OPHP1|nr:serine threonine protein kinase [Ophiostoma piceae UAMH 11346]